jgi:tRNA modification GTPase
VTEVPGTTRDALEAVIDAGPWALRLVDTAGLRETADRIERMGIEVSEQYLERAAIVLACGDSDATIDAVIERVGARTSSPMIVVRTKADLGDTDHLVPESYQTITDGQSAGHLPTVAVSAERGTGLVALLDLIVHTLSASVTSIDDDTPVLTRARHRRSVEEAIQELSAFQAGWKSGALPAPVAATHLRAAVLALEGLIGVVDVEDVLDRVFSSFCVGK